MKKTIKLLLRAVLFLAAIAAIYVVGNILYATLTDFKPPEKLWVEVRNPVPTKLRDSILTFFTWNIGYGGLGDQENFFYDGGTMVRPSAERVQTNVDGILSTLKKVMGTDFIFIQEIDSNSKRTYYTNEFSMFADSLKPGYNAAYGMNFLVKYLPMPLERPWDVIGKVESGIATYSRFEPLEVTRYQYPSAFPYPKRVFMLKRCFMAERFNLPDGKQLVTINTHLSAFDNTGKLKAEEMAYLRKYLLNEYAKGNYVIVGGDWNQNPPGFDNNTFAIQKHVTEQYPQTGVKEDFMPPDWKWAYDPTTPSNRNVVTGYDPNKTFTTIIDFYLLSPNVQLLEVKGMPMAFKYSDHQPVLMKAKLKDF